jgi:hypothetical protein
MDAGCRRAIRERESIFFPKSRIQIPFDMALLLSGLWSFGLKS